MAKENCEVRGKPDDDVHHELLSFKRLQPTGSGDNIYVLDEHVELTYHSVFHEPLGSRNWPVIDGFFYTIFTYTQVYTYRIMSLLLGAIFGVVWGVSFGILNSVIVWIVQPLLKLLFVGIRVFSNPWRVGIRAGIDPFFQSIGLAYSSIKASFDVRYSGPSLPRGNQQMDHV
ncbi:caveolin-3-like [Saccoglossus kowalevskii]|uniref:Caveolin n=1 Tax=Saccoglossus kowalevskii TaxID=10224 RepID=A0ABM0LTS5_SACKO|nr:PREDICTED: caveolin-1-like [Saccoglossus kowalevskii]